MNAAALDQAIMPVFIMLGGIMVISIMTLAVIVVMYRNRRLSWTMSGRLFRAVAVLFVCAGAMWLVFQWIIDWSRFFSDHPRGPWVALDVALFGMLDEFWARWSRASLVLQLPAAFVAGLLVTRVLIVPVFAVARGARAAVLSRAGR